MLCFRLHGHILRLSLRNFSVILIIRSAPYRYFLVIQPIKMELVVSFSHILIAIVGNPRSCSCHHRNYHRRIKLYY